MNKLRRVFYIHGVANQVPILSKANAWKRRAYAAQHPTTALLVIEIAVTSPQRDCELKLGVYAQAGVPECWLVNLRKRCVRSNASLQATPTSRCASTRPTKRLHCCLRQSGQCPCATR